MAHIDISALERDPRLFLYTSLTSGSSHIVTATSRLETILKANKIPFQAIDTATDERARRLWQRRSQGKKLPALVKDGYVLGDLEEIEEWNEFGELKENIGPVPAGDAAVPAGAQTGVNIAPPIAVNHPFTGQHGASSIAPRAFPIPGEQAQRIALPGAAEIAAMAKARIEAVGAKSKEGAGLKEAEKMNAVGSGKEVAVESQTGVTSTAPALTTAAGETVEPIRDADLETKDVTGGIVEEREERNKGFEDVKGEVEGGQTDQEEEEEKKQVDDVKKEVKKEGEKGKVGEEGQEEEQKILEIKKQEKPNDKKANVPQADDIVSKSEPDVPVKSQTEESSTAADMTDASGETIEPIKDADVEVNVATTAPDANNEDKQASPSAIEKEDAEDRANSHTVQSKEDEAELSSKQVEVEGVDGLAIVHEQEHTRTQEQDAKAPEHTAESVGD